MNFQQDQKGLFTFYRQQEELQRQIRKRKKQIKQKKQKQKEQSQRLLLEAAEKQRIIRQHRQLQLQKLRQKIKSQRKPIYQPRYKQQKYEKKNFNNQVIIVNHLKEKKVAKTSLDDPLRQRSFFKDNQQKCKGYFLQNKQVPFSFGQVSLQKSMLDEKEKQKIKMMPVPLNYYNKYALGNQKKYIPSYSYEKLPQVPRKHRVQSMFQKPYKSKKIQIALKSQSTEILRKIRKSIKQQVVQKQQRVSFINYTGNQYQEKPTLKLNDQQKKIIEIINRSRNHQ